MENKENCEKIKKRASSTSIDEPEDFEKLMQKYEEDTRAVDTLKKEFSYDKHEDSWGSFEGASDIT